MRARRTAALSISFTTIAALATPLLAAPAAGAPQSVIYTSPKGSGSACSMVKPCSIETGFTTAAGGTTLMIGAGVYGSVKHPVTSPLNSDSSALVEGQPGKPSPVIYSEPTSGSDGIYTRGSLRHITVFYGSASPAESIAVNVNGAVVDHVAVFDLDKTSYNACDLEPEGSYASIKYSDLECYSASDLGEATGAEVRPNQGQPMTITGVTAVAPGAYGLYVDAGDGSGGTTAATVTNCVLQGKTDLGGDSSGDTSLLVTVEHSDFKTHDLIGLGSRTATLHRDSTDITAAPKFRNATKLDFAEKPSSPTVNAGAPDPKSDTDIQGLPRTLGKAPDMGAFELAQKATVSKPVIKNKAKSSLAASVKVDPEGLPTMVTLLAIKGGRTYASHVKSIDGDKRKRLSLRVTGLKPGSYRLRVKAINLAGTAESASVHAKTAR